MEPKGCLYVRSPLVCAALKQQDAQNASSIWTTCSLEDKGLITVSRHAIVTFIGSSDTFYLIIMGIATEEIIIKTLGKICT
jgi:hypothetical protein